MAEGFNAYTICLGVRQALAVASLLAFEAIRSVGCCCWLEALPSWKEALALLLENADVEYSGCLEELLERGCGLSLLHFLEEAVSRLLGEEGYL